MQYVVPRRIAPQYASVKCLYWNAFAGNGRRTCRYQGRFWTCDFTLFFTLRFCVIQSYNFDRSGSNTHLNPFIRSGRVKFSMS